MREDEEQERKFQEIIELLLAAGYFRARIKGLSPFDKVICSLIIKINQINSKYTLTKSHYSLQYLVLKSEIIKEIAFYNNIHYKLND